jgi:hypothetical protein
VLERAALLAEEWAAAELRERSSSVKELLS